MDVTLAAERPKLIQLSEAFSVVSHTAQLTKPPGPPKTAGPKTSVPPSLAVAAGLSSAVGLNGAPPLTRHRGLARIDRKVSWAAARRGPAVLAGPTCMWHRSRGWGGGQAPGEQRRVERRAPHRTRRAACTMCAQQVRVRLGLAS